MATAQNKIIHRFIRPIADYEQGGTYYKRIIPVDTQAYAYYTKTEENEKEGLFYVFGDGVHTYIELREGKGRTESSKEWPVVSQEDISGKIDTLIAGANVVITGEGAERTISVPNMPIANKFLSSADLEKVEMGELLEKQYISLIKPLLNDVEIQVNDIVIYNTNEQLLVTEVDLESQTFGGVIIYVPYKDFKISFEQVEGNLLDNTSAKETLDTKLDKQNIPNKLYGIDAEGNQFLYNVTEVGIEEAPQDEKEYVRNNGAWVEIDHSKVLDDASPSPTTTYSSLKIDTELSNLKEAIVSLNSFEIQVVDTLPEVGDDRCIYLVPADQEEEKDIYNEYIYINNKWELLGSTEIDLSGYATKEELYKKIQDEVAIRVQEDNFLQEKIDTLQANDEKLEIEINKKQNTLVAGQHISIDSTSNTISAEGFVESVNGLTGVVTIDKTTVGLDRVDNTSDLEKPISNATQTAISTETNRAIKEESRLVQLIATNSEDIKAKADKTTVDNLAKQIEPIPGQVNQALNMANDALEAVRTEEARAEEQESILESSISNEVKRAKAKEEELSTQISEETARATTKESELEQSIANEITRAKDEEGSLLNKINEEVQRATNKESSLSEEIKRNTDLISTTQDLVSSIRTDLNSEISRAKEAEQSLDNKIDSFDGKIEAETERALKAEKVLDTKIKNEEIRAIREEQQLSSLLNLATSHLTDIQNTLEKKQDTLIAGENVTIVNNVISAEGKIKEIQVEGEPVEVKNGIVNLTGIEGADYTIKKAASTSTVYASSYQLYKDNVPVGEAINLPKDLFIVDGSVKEVTENDVPVSGFKKGEKYLDLELSSSNLGHIYIRLADLGMTYIAGDGISIIGNTISMNLDILNSKADKADSLEGYGIKNAYTKSEVDMLVLHNLTYEEIL